VRSASRIRAELDIIRQASESVLAHGRYVLGPEVTVLEERLARRIGTRHAIGCNSGFGAHLLSLLALDVGSGSRVLVSPFSPPSFAGAIVRCNAQLCLADVAPGDFHISPIAAKNRMTEADVVVVHHLFGGAADMPAICRVADDKTIIEVITYSFDTRVAGGTNVGTYGAVAVSCLRETTTLGAYGDAGMIWTNDGNLADRLREIRQEHTEVYNGVVSGNFHMDTIHAAILVGKLEFRAEEFARRQERARTLISAISNSGAEGVVVPTWYGNMTTRFVILAEHRDELREHLEMHRIRAEPWWPVPLHLQPGFRDLGYSRGDFPNAEYIAAHSLRIPLSEDPSELQRTADLLAQFHV
jgi:UDP-2-acetamido-2-deoxy-ribo-hexuluronate aminotransferase